MAAVADTPIVTIVTPCRNAARFLDRMFDSVAAQTLRRWEHIVVDDGSSDESAEVIAARAAGDRRVRLVQHAARGVAAARNEGYRHACTTSRYVYFLDADDALDPEMLAVLTSYLDVHPDVGLAFCDAAWIDGEDRPIPSPVCGRYVPTPLWARTLEPGEPDTPFVAVYCWAPVMESCSVLRRSVFDRTAGWDESLGQGGEGVDLFLRVALASRIHHVPQVLYRYRRHAAQHSRDWAQHDRQARAIEDKWRSLPDLDDRQRALVSAAHRFRHGRLRAVQLTGAARRYLARGRVTHAAVCAREAARAWAGEMLGW